MQYLIRFMQLYMIYILKKEHLSVFTPLFTILFNDLDQDIFT